MSDAGGTGVREVRPAVAVKAMMTTAVDLRDRTLTGRRKREEFERSLHALRLLELPDEIMKQAVQSLRQTGPRLSRTLVQMGLLSERQLARAVAERWGLVFTE